MSNGKSAMVWGGDKEGMRLIDAALISCRRGLPSIDAFRSFIYPCTILMTLLFVCSANNAQDKEIERQGAYCRDIVKGDKIRGVSAYFSYDDHRLISERVVTNTSEELPYVIYDLFDIDIDTVNCMSHMKTDLFSAGRSSLFNKGKNILVTDEKSLVSYIYTATNFELASTVKSYIKISGTADHMLVYNSYRNLVTIDDGTQIKCDYIVRNYSTEELWIIDLPDKDIGGSAWYLVEDAFIVWDGRNLYIWQLKKGEERATLVNVFADVSNPSDYYEIVYLGEDLVCLPAIVETDQGRVRVFRVISFSDGRVLSVINNIASGMGRFPDIIDNRYSAKTQKVVWLESRLGNFTNIVSYDLNTGQRLKQVAISGQDRRNSSYPSSWVRWSKYGEDYHIYHLAWTDDGDESLLRVISLNDMKEIARVVIQGRSTVLGKEGYVQLEDQHITYVPYTTMYNDNDDSKKP